MIVHPRASVRIYTKESLESVATLLSEKLFAGLPFGGKHLNLFDEVPALRLEANLLGLFVALHGQAGEYMLLIQPKPNVASDCPADISNYVAALVRDIGPWQVEVPKA